ncbi:hypothetical protein [Olivibacter sitiensis]|uniref:hypothetical protein n=1 Tax=Olivibacter sitiensis TaxID=376470 RepID=UPI001FE1A329|nr:hypothetical protein [Olivibacter sitiensis]
MENRQKSKKVWVALAIPSLLLGGALCFSSCNTINENNSNSMNIKEQGSFMVGGTKTTQPGTFNVDSALNPQGQTFHSDHAYAFYQIPENANKLPLVFLHGAGESKKHGKPHPMDGKASRISFSAESSRFTCWISPDVAMPAGVPLRRP